jgi:hypothetical protein
MVKIRQTMKRVLPQRYKTLCFTGVWLYSDAIADPGWQLEQRRGRGVGVPEFERTAVELEQQHRLSARSPPKPETAFLREAVCAEGKRSYTPSLPGLRSSLAGKISTGAGGK